MEKLRNFISIIWVLILSRGMKQLGSRELVLFYFEIETSDIVKYMPQIYSRAVLHRMLHSLE